MLMLQAQFSEIQSTQRSQKDSLERQIGEMRQDLDLKGNVLQSTEQNLRKQELTVRDL